MTLYKHKESVLYNIPVDVAERTRGVVALTIVQSRLRVIRRGEVEVRVKDFYLKDFSSLLSSPDLSTSRGKGIKGKG